MYSFGFHTLSCRHNVGCVPRHAKLNKSIKYDLGVPGIPSQLKLARLYRKDGKRLGSIINSNAGPLIWLSHAIMPFSAAI